MIFNTPCTAHRKRDAYVRVSIMEAQAGCGDGREAATGEAGVGERGSRGNQRLNCQLIGSDIGQGVRKTRSNEWSVYCI